MTVPPAIARAARPAVGLICGLLTGLGGIAAGADETAPASRSADGLDVRVGFDGVYRTGSWTPLVVSLPTGVPQKAATVHAWVEDPDGQFVRSPPAAVETHRDGTRTARVCVRFGRPTGRLLVEAEGLSGEGNAAAQAPAAAGRGLVPHTLPPPIASTETILLVLGDLPAAGRAARLLAGDDGARPRVVALEPDAGLGGAGRAGEPRDFDAADAIIVCGAAVAAGDFDQRTLEGIDGWVRRGGRLVFVAGVSAARVRPGESPLAGWLPGPVGRLVPLRRTSAIETYAHADRPIEKSVAAGLQVPLLDNARSLEGAVEAFAGSTPGDLPLVVRRGHGFGTITWIGLDVDQGAFRNWSGTDTLLVELLGGREKGGGAGRAGETRRGPLDLAGQLRTAVDQFPGVSAVPFEVIAGLSILYVLCLYPLDWWLVSRGGGRPWLAWFSLPLLVTLAGGLAWLVADRWKGTATQFSRADVVDIDAAGGLARGFSFAGVWSPTNTAIDLSAGPAAAVPTAGPADIAVSWLGAAGRGIGATDAPIPHPSLASTDYSYGPSLAALEAVPIAAASSRLFEAEWSAPLADPPVSSTFGRDGQGTLKGKLVNRLPFPLEQCVLMHAGWLYDVGRLDCGQAFEPGNGRGPRSLAGAITRRAASSDRDVASRWDVDGTDVGRILELAGFHAAAGGRAYTSLESGRLARLDLSPLLQLDRAVLVGLGPCGTLWSGERPIPSPDGMTLWRIVMPLGGNPDDRREPDRSVTAP
jgi:hypothetical protein